MKGALRKENDRHRQVHMAVGGEATRETLVMQQLAMGLPQISCNAARERTYPSHIGGQHVLFHGLAADIIPLFLFS